MTNAVSDTSGRQLDFTGDSIQLTTRKGADLIWTHRFQDENDRALPINNWMFVETNLTDSTGSVRDGVDSNGRPVLRPIDIRKIDSEQDAMNAITTLGVVSGRYTASSTLLEFDFAAGEQPTTVPPNMFFRIMFGLQGPFLFTSDMVNAGSGGWEIIGPGIPMGQTDFVDSGTYSLEQRAVPFDFVDAIQCYFQTAELQSVNPSSGRSNNAPFEIETRITSTGLLDSNGQGIEIRQVVASGIVTVFSDVYTAPTTP